MRLWSAVISFLLEFPQLGCPPHQQDLNLICVLADQFIACGKSSDMAHELASQIWLAVVDGLEENERTFCLLKNLALEADVS